MLHNMKKVKTILFAMLLFTGNLFAQDYGTGIGLRLGGLSSGISVKGFVNSTSALEGIASFGRHSFIATGLYEKHFAIPGATGLNMYVGAGGHIGFFGYRGSYFYKKKNEYYYVYDEGRTAVVPGVDLIIGLEYKIKDVPLAIGVDIKPFIDFFDGSGFYFDGALNIRYVF
jgi:hypothetical protein